jgi:hypothetical protein
MPARSTKVTLDLFSIPIRGIKPRTLRPVWKQFKGVNPQVIRDRSVHAHLQRFLTEESIDRYVDAGDGETVGAIEYLLTQISLHGAFQFDEPYTKRSIAHLLNLLPQEEKIRAALAYLYRAGAMWQMAASKEMRRGSSLLPQKSEWTCVTGPTAVYSEAWGLRRSCRSRVTLQPTGRRSEGGYGRR